MGLPLKIEVDAGAEEVAPAWGQSAAPRWFGGVYMPAATLALQTPGFISPWNFS
jgi:hypothetical protein